MKRCLGDISSDKMAISIRGFAGFLAPVGFGLRRRDIFHRGELDETSGERLQKWDKTAFFPLPDIFFFFFAGRVIRSLLRVDWGEGGPTTPEMNSLWSVSHPFSTLMKTVQRKLSAAVAVVVVAVAGGRFGERAKPKIKMTAVTSLDAAQIYPTDASRKLNNPCRLYLCAICVCVYMCMCLTLCVCLM